MIILHVCKRKYINGRRFMAIFRYSVDSSAALFHILPPLQRLLSSRWDSAPATLHFPPATFFQFENPDITRNMRDWFTYGKQSITKVRWVWNHLSSFINRYVSLKNNITTWGTEITIREWKTSCEIRNYLSFENVKHSCEIRNYTSRIINCE